MHSGCISLESKSVQMLTQSPFIKDIEHTMYGIRSKYKQWPNDVKELEATYDATFSIYIVEPRLS